MKISRRSFAFASAALAAVPLSAAPKASRIRVLLIDGINNHDWKKATRGIRMILERTGRFSVEVSTTPAADAPAAAWQHWRPEFHRYDVVINNFNAGHAVHALQWPTPVQTVFEQYVEQGGGLVIFHAANNAFLNWEAYNQMIGLGWRPPAFGPGIALADNGELLYIPKGEGMGPNHPKAFDFPIHVRSTHHPITQGMPAVWMHPLEQLTHGQHGPAEGLTILTWAHSPMSGHNEPMDWVRDYGRGRVFTTSQGHTWLNDPSTNFDCVGFQTLLARGVEWAATGNVTLPIPANFPTATEIRTQPLGLDTAG